MSLWSKLGKWLNKTITGVTFVFLVIMMLIVVANVTGRLLFRSPIWGAVESVGLCGVILISFALSFTERDRGHITVGMLVEKLTQRLKSIFAIVSFCLGIAVVLLLALGGSLEAWQAATTPGSYTIDLGINYTPFKVIWVIGCLMFCGFLLYHLLQELKGK